MLNKAIDKIRDEMAANASNEYVQCVGEYLTDFLSENPSSAEAVLADGLTIVGSLEKMRDFASKHKKNNFAVVTPEIGFKIVCKYFGMKAEKKAKTADDCGFDLSLDSLLGD